MHSCLLKYILITFIISLLSNGIYSRHNELRDLPIISTSGRHYKVIQADSNRDSNDYKKQHILESPKYSTLQLQGNDDNDDDDEYVFMIDKLSNMSRSDIHKEELCLRHIKYPCIVLHGFIMTTEVEINGKYCVYQCNEMDPLYPEYIQQETCDYYIKWTTDSSYMIYSYSQKTNKSQSDINIYASSKDCDPNKIALSNMQSCAYWKTYYDGIEETSVSIHPYEGVEISANLCTDTPVLLGLDSGEIACIVIFMILIFLCVFGGAINYWEFY